MNIEHKGQAYRWRDGKWYSITDEGEQPVADVDLIRKLIVLGAMGAPKAR